MHRVKNQVNRVRGLLTIRTTADAIRVDPYSVWRWVQTGKLHALRKGRHWLIPASEVIRKIKERKEVINMPTKRELEQRIEEMEDKLEEARDLIDEALEIDSEEDEED